MANSSGLLTAMAVVGVYYGLNMLQVPNGREVAQLCVKHDIKRMRLHEPNETLLQAFENQAVMSVSLDISNAVLKNLNDDTSVKNWYDTFVSPFGYWVHIEFVVVGEDGHSNILPTMKRLRRLFDSSNFTSVRLTTIISYTSLAPQDPPSAGAFHPNMKDSLKDILNFLANEDRSLGYGPPILMVKLYPFQKYVYDNRGVISLGYATFDGTDSVKDGPYTYHNLLDAMVDTIYVAIEKLEGEKLKNIRVWIGETGWPTEGHGKDTSVALARKYNENFIAHASSYKGTPRRPNIPIPGYIRSVFNEDQRPQGESQHYGIFKKDFTPIYPLFGRK